MTHSTFLVEGTHLVKLLQLLHAHRAQIVPGKCAQKQIALQHSPLSGLINQSSPYCRLVLTCPIERLWHRPVLFRLSVER